MAEAISVAQLLEMFPDEEACHAWLAEARWQGNPVCPHCGGGDSFSRPPSKPHAYWHKDCRKTFTVTTGTCMHATKLPLRSWIYGIYSVMTARKGVSAMQLSKELGVQYRTAWHMLHRIREACGRGDFKLETLVEVDETYVGGKEGNKHASRKLNQGRGTVGKTPVAGIRERDGRVKAKPLTHADTATLVGFVAGNVAPGAFVYTDAAAAYAALPDTFTHETVNHGQGEYVRGEVHTNSIESVWSVLKRSIHGTWHHVSPKHLARYVNEATFRLNEGNCKVDTIARMREFARGIAGRRLSYADLIAHNGLSARCVPV